MPQAQQGNVIVSSTQINPAVVLGSDIANDTITDANINSAAAIAKTKLANLDVVNADVNASAAIVDTKLATITTAGKVSGAALTLLGNTPAGAGQIPAANLTNITIYKNGTTSKDLADANTTQNIAHGLGVTPKFIKLIGILATTAQPGPYSFFAYNGTTGSGISADNNSSSPAATAETTIILKSGTNGKFQTGTVTFDATNIIITWVQTSNPTGIAQILWEANS